MLSISQCLLKLGSAMLLVAAVLGPPARADLYDDFEDGNWTSNPTWFDMNGAHGQDGGIVSDPIRPSNLVWKATGTGGAHQHIATTDFTPMTWETFRCSVEVLNVNGFFNASLCVRDVMPIPPLGEGFAVGGSNNYDGSGLGYFWLGEANSGSMVPVQRNWNVSQVAPNEWLQFNLWYDANSGLVKGDLRRLSDGYVLAEDSLDPASFGSLPLAHLEISAGSPSWNYLDNPTLVPEPASLSLFLLGILHLVGFRR